MNYTKKINRNFSMTFVIFKNYILIIHYMIFIILYMYFYFHLSIYKWYIELTNYSSNIFYKFIVQVNFFIAIYVSYILTFHLEYECTKNYQRNITFFHHLPSQLRYQRSPLTGNPPGEGEKRNGSKPRVAHRGVACNSACKQPLLSSQLCVALQPSSRVPLRE